MPEFLFQEIARKLEGEINKGVYPQGSRLPSERVLAEQYGVSRNVLREAIRMLQEKGFVEVKASRGAFVSKPNSLDLTKRMRAVLDNSSTSLEDIVEAREVLEVAIAECAINRMTPEKVEKLRNIYDEMQDTMDYPSEYAELDRKFHLQIARCTENDIIQMIGDSIYCIASERLFLLSPLNPPRLLSGQMEHRTMIDCLEKGDKKRLLLTIHLHINCLREQLSPL